MTKNDWTDPYSVKIDYSLAPSEFNDVILVLQHSAETGKYGRNDWLNGINFDKERNYSSVRRHHEDSRSGLKKDPESGLDPRLHAACRLLMEYTLDRREDLEDNKYMDELAALHQTTGQYEMHPQHCSCNSCRNYFDGDSQ